MITNNTILQINSNANVGSTGHIAEQIGESAIQHGWNSYIAYGRDVRDSKSNLIKIGRKIDWLYHAFMTRLTDRHGLFSTRATRKLVQQIEKIKPDIIHLHNIHGYYLNYKVLFEYLNKSNIPVVWTLHDCWPMTGHCAHFEYAKCNRWKTICHACPVKDGYPASCFFDRSQKNYIEKREIFNSVKNLTIVPVSNWLGNIVKSSFLKECEVNVIHNGIDIQKFQPIQSDFRDKFSIFDKKIVLGVAAAWSDRKGLKDFVSLLELLPSQKYQIVLIGLSAKQLKQLPSGIIGLAKTESVEELVQWYSVADVYANLSYAETFGLTTAEALASGTPAVVYNNTAIPELVNQSIGRVVENGDIEGVAKAIENLCAEDKAEMCKRCREYAVSHFDKEDSYQKYIKLYEEIIQKQ